MIIIPIYKNKPSENDIISLKQTNRVLGDHYPIAFVCPYNLEQIEYQSLIPKAEFICFDKKYFEGIEGYNKMLTSPFFYKTFLKHEYILICQTDVFVFNDEFKNWCKKGYDYIGSPWIVKPPQVKEKVIFDMNDWTIGKVGNGGFSLRKTKIFYRFSFFIRLIYSVLGKNEDFIWCIILPLLYPFLKFPKADEALHFCIELEPQKSYEKIGKLPFATHAWEKYEPEFWKKYVK